MEVKNKFPKDCCMVINTLLIVFPHGVLLLSLIFDQVLNTFPGSLYLFLNIVS